MNYSQTVLENYRHPKNFGKLNDATHVAEDLNPLCGDEIKIYLKVDGSKINDMRYEARGCALSIAAASALSEHILNHESRITDVKKIHKSDIQNWLAVKVEAARESCITLALNAIKKALNT